MAEVDCAYFVWFKLQAAKEPNFLLGTAARGFFRGPELFQIIVGKYFDRFGFSWFHPKKTLRAYPHFYTNH